MAGNRATTSPGASPSLPASSGASTNSNQAPFIPAPCSQRPSPGPPSSFSASALFYPCFPLAGLTPLVRFLFYLSLSSSQPYPAPFRPPPSPTQSHLPKPPSPIKVPKKTQNNTPQSTTNELHRRNQRRHLARRASVLLHQRSEMVHWPKNDH